uniref:Zinc-finger domain-containing protein n=1 Tax=uncultured prokaryote TaxID=198431 RepID=H5SKU8_9ZZZZ|nr:hypothetical protein HGMM_F42G09C10 [uncultured prokaryote]
MSCEEIQGLLEQGTRDEAVTAHVASCGVCAAHAALLRQLGGLAPESEEQQPQWISRLPHPPWLWYKPATYLPLLLGFSALGFGLAGLGKGLPGQGELGLLARAFWEVTGLAVGEALLIFSRQAASVWGFSPAVAAVGAGVAGVLLLRWGALKVRA